MTELTDREARPDRADVPPAVDGPELLAALEAILLVVDEPADDVVLAQVLERPREQVLDLLRQLSRDYDDRGRGIELRQVAGGWRLYTRRECAPYVERFVRDGRAAKLSQAALETLAVIAYQQPVTRGRVAAVRGVSVDAVVRTLVARGLVDEAGVQPETGAVLYVTTDLFLERLGVDSLEDLPSLSEHLPDHTFLDDAAVDG